jgi:hypothetical protein
MSNTLPPLFQIYGGSYDKVIAQSRERNAVMRSKAKAKIDGWLSKDYGVILEEEKKKKQESYEKKKTEMANKGPLSEAELQAIREERKQKKNDKKKYNPFLQATNDDRKKCVSSGTTRTASKTTGCTG